MDETNALLISILSEMEMTNILKMFELGLITPEAVQKKLNQNYSLEWTVKGTFKDNYGD